ncbi:MAG TPA: hypothetical protein H9870_02885 [Candidatus Corynebacterium avicola]|uniref:Uncharacterized protein n=1 Tax=Candidatus Corynebacterium avicola TaxID=2838527 RepID=A0A9D1RP11_9CORY|nr:hypothetical protein [Candidatus Corynebacterium avicola]
MNDILVEGLGALGALGGGAGAGGAGASGGAQGGRLGARLTKLDGEQQMYSSPSSDAHRQTVQDDFFGGTEYVKTDEESGPGEPILKMVGVVGSGAMNMNPCVVQLVWSARELHAYAHAKEGLIKQRTCAKALLRLGDVLNGAGH